MTFESMDSYPGLQMPSRSLDVSRTGPVNSWRADWVWVLCACLGLVLVTGCSPSDVLDVAPPSGVQTADALKNRTGAEATFAAAKGEMFASFIGNETGNLVYYVDLSTDEYRASALASGGPDANVDARQTEYISGRGEPTDQVFSALLTSYSELLLARDGLVAYEIGANRKMIGETYALVGYVELGLAENFCPGVVLDRTLLAGGVEYGTPLTTDSLFATAEIAFDSALANTNGDTAVTLLASVGLARARLGRGHFSDAAAAVANVPTSFVYWMDTPTTYSNGASPNVYYFFTGSSSCYSTNVSDREGGNGLPYVSAHDPRMPIDSSHTTCDLQNGLVGATEGYYPSKFGTQSTRVALATGVEARLIEAEASLQGGDATTWATKLNGLRDAAANTYLAIPAFAHLTTDSTTGASATMQQDVMFRERAFWLFGMGTRLGDLRRLVRQYHRNTETVFPTGTYVNGTVSGMYTPLPTYGTDVSFTLPTAASGTLITNPHYQGCLATSA